MPSEESVEMQVMCGSGHQEAVLSATPVDITGDAGCFHGAQTAILGQVDKTLWLVFYDMEASDIDPETSFPFWVEQVKPINGNPLKRAYRFISDLPICYEKLSAAAAYEDGSHYDGNVLAQIYLSGV